MMPAALAVLSSVLLAACASTVDGSKEPPADWVSPVGAKSESCRALSGIFEANGEPAPENSSEWLYNTIWPSRGSLPTMLRTSANGVSPADVGAVRIDIDSHDQMRFTALNANRTRSVLEASRWTCRRGQLVSSTELSQLEGSGDTLDRVESRVRLWRSPDGSLIAENTIVMYRESLMRGPKPKPSARFYFRFRPIGLAP